ncbi:TcmI family type II polyketide cyclase [Streptomyces tricolor]|nr:TcmI family type II polyketide cyclase [Streptomyces tricolor]
MHQALIVARMAPGSAPDIAKVFGESRPGRAAAPLVGVVRRGLFQFGDVYMHLIESDREPGPAIAKVTSHPEFREVSERLSAYVQRVSIPRPGGPRSDAMAQALYVWERDRGV